MRHDVFIEVRTLGWLSQNNPEQLTLPKKPGYMEIIWVKKAAGTCVIDLEKQAIREGGIYCIGTRQLRCFQADPEMEGYYISFVPALVNLSFQGSLSFFETGLNGAREKIDVPEESESSDDMEQIIRNMMKELSRPFDVDFGIVRSLLSLLMTYLARCAKQGDWEPNCGRKYELISRFLLSVEKNYTTRRMVHDYAAELGISGSYLNFIVKKETGYTAIHHIHQRKLLEAKKQIVWHGKSLKEVAYHLGFNDPPHFSNFFKAKTGMNFQHFRNGLQANNLLQF